MLLWTMRPSSTERGGRHEGRPHHHLRAGHAGCGVCGDLVSFSTRWVPDRRRANALLRRHADGGRSQVPDGSADEERHDAHAGRRRPGQPAARERARLQQHEQGRGRLRPDAVARDRVSSICSSSPPRRARPWTDPGTQADFIAHEMGATERKNAAGLPAGQDRRRGFRRAASRSSATATSRTGAGHACPSTFSVLLTLRRRRRLRRTVKLLPRRRSRPFHVKPRSSSTTGWRTAATCQCGHHGARHARRSGQHRGRRRDLPEQSGSVRRPTSRKRRDSATSSALAASRRLPRWAPAHPSRKRHLGRTPAAARSPRSLPEGGAPGTQSYTEPATGNRMVTGAPGRYSQGDVLNMGPAPLDLTSRTPVASAPAGAPEPPRFPGGIPQPRPRPQTGPSLPPDDRLLGAGPTVAEMGSPWSTRWGSDYA